VSDASRIGASARRLVSLVGELAETRLALAAVELEEHRLYVSRQFASQACALFLVGIGTMWLGAWLVLVTPPEWRTTVVGVLALVFLGAAAVIGITVRRRAARHPMLLHHTLAELRKDLALLRGPEER
jgi:uncharacterized membrane protein YqjE